MSPDVEFFLRNNIALQLQSARLALLRGEQAVFEQTLDDTSALLNEYFDRSSAAVAGALETIAEIRGHVFSERRAGYFRVAAPAAAVPDTERERAVKFGIIVVVVLFASAFGAHFLLADPGYVIINFRGYVIEMSVPVLAGFAVAFVLAVWLIRKIIVAPRRLGEAAGRYRSARSGQKLTKGMIAVAEGNFARGEKMLAAPRAPVIHHCSTTCRQRAPHTCRGAMTVGTSGCGSPTRTRPKRRTPVLLDPGRIPDLIVAKMSRHWQRCGGWKRTRRTTAQALALMGRLYFKLKDWDSLGRLLPRLRKNTQIKPETLEKWTVRVHKEGSDTAADADVLDHAWKGPSRASRSDMTLLEAYYDGLMRAGLHDRAEKELGRRTQIELAWATGAAVRSRRGDRHDETTEACRGLAQEPR